MSLKHHVVGSTSASSCLFLDDNHSGTFVLTYCDAKGDVNLTFHVRHYVNYSDRHSVGHISSTYSVQFSLKEK